VTQLAIVREEAHLDQLFGAEWRAYAARTARWFGR
jgi:protein-S-isoprenylcysteine O-methyltransferase Ste14